MLLHRVILHSLIILLVCLFICVCMCMYMCAITHMDIYVYVHLCLNMRALKYDFLFSYLSQRRRHTALHWASHRGHHEIVQLLLEARPDVNRLDRRELCTSDNV